MLEDVHRVGLIVDGFFFNDTATTEIYTCCHTLSRHYALPIVSSISGRWSGAWLMKPDNVPPCQSGCQLGSDETPSWTKNGAPDPGRVQRAICRQPIVPSALRPTSRVQFDAWAQVDRESVV